MSWGRTGRTWHRSLLLICVVGAGLLTVGTAHADVSVDPGFVDFGAVRLYGYSQEQSVRLTNNGPENIAVYSTETTGEFRVLDDFLDCSGRILVPGASCDVRVDFHPTTEGPKSGQLIFHDDSPTGTHHADLAGMGESCAAAGCVATLEPATGDFGTVGPGAPPDPITFRLTNTGTDYLYVSAARTTGPFSIESTDCEDVSLGTNESCSAEVSFFPVSAGQAQGTLTFDDSAPGVTSASLVGFATGSEERPQNGQATVVQVSAPVGNPVTLVTTGPVSNAGGVSGKEKHLLALPGGPVTGTIAKAEVKFGIPEVRSSASAAELTIMIPGAPTIEIFGLSVVARAGCGVEHNSTEGTTTIASLWIDGNRVTPKSEPGPDTTVDLGSSGALVLNEQSHVGPLDELGLRVIGVHLILNAGDRTIDVAIGIAEAHLSGNCGGC